MRKMVKVITLALATLSVLMVLTPTLASPRGPTVRILGDNSVRINQRVVSSYHFGPSTIRVRPGATVTFENIGPCSVPFDCAHTISIVNKAQLPVSVAQVFACLFDQPGTVCDAISSVHFPQGPGGPAIGRANVTGEPSGFHGANSLLISHGQTLEVIITAEAGATIHYMCAIHPWMQANIIVGQGDDNSESD